MPSEVSVRLAADQEYRFDLSSAEPMAHEAARLWLDEQFTTLDCEPLRASGKVLLADKVLTVAQAAGAALFSQAEWGQRFALAASAALARPIVRVDVPAMAITY
ncbi:hypothetical protein ACDW_10720 [Acidovorax sp. DW039]|jgi:hypothetical protein|uniref:hypothetical protein n=1 Tax=Acidovorax TaxID=12916 RepID=UPI001D74080B|nr:hypothetical protein [Acidovorax temperans]MBA4062011.1 hypothetical protein [Verminephrobacter sp.]WCT25241.1 hypothetical protein PQV96_04145 [Acidovorax temperans]BEU95367.1 hypothetical protein ACDW_10720 [Acidovorax sp. DW039]